MGNYSKRIENTKHIKHISWAPNFWLTHQGKRDSKKGEGVADAKIDTMLNRCAAIEHWEVIAAEETLFPIRSEAALLLNVVAKVPDNSAESTSDSSMDPIVRRAQKKAAIEHARQAQERSAAERRLPEIRQKLLHGDTILRERIEKTRSKACLTKINAYVKGLRSGKLPNYQPKINFDDSAYLLYMSNHKKDDEVIGVVYTD